MTLIDETGDRLGQPDSLRQNGFRVKAASPIGGPVTSATSASGADMFRRGVAALTAVVVLAGCSSANPNEPGLLPGKEGVAAVVNAWAVGLVNGDPARACSLMTVEAQERLNAATRTSSCLDAVGGWRQAHAGAAQWSVREDDVQIAGDRATVHVPSGAAAVPGIIGPRGISIVTEDSRWTVAVAAP